MSVREPVLLDDQRRHRHRKTEMQSTTTSYQREVPEGTASSTDRDAVNNIKTLLVSGLINPFISSSFDLLNIATGDKCVSLDLLEAKEKGQEALSRAEETLNTTVTPVRLQTFHEKRQKPVESLKTNIYQKGNNVVRSLHFLRHIDSESFSYKWPKYPASLFEPDDQGCVMRKGIKADYVVAKKTKFMVYNVE